jgi:electron transport complex protein RnfC
MMKRSFVGFTKPRLRYSTAPSPVKELPVPRQVTLLLPQAAGGNGSGTLKIGQAVKTGQRLSSGPDGETYVISSVTGTVSGLAPYVGNGGRRYTAITIDAVGTDDWDDSFDKKAGLATALKFLGCLPGGPSFKVFDNPEKNVRTIVVCGMDQDLLLTANQYVVQHEGADIKAGIEALKKITGVDRFLLVVPEYLVQQATGTGAEVKTAGNEYPNGLPAMIMKNILGQAVLEGETPEDNGVTFFSAEAVAAVGAAFRTGRLPVTKTVTVIGKDGRVTNVRTKVGTAVGEVLQACQISAEDGDRLILGGPMTGAATYSDALPVQLGTDGVVVQSGETSAQTTDYPCVNCGECVRICPVRIPVNMLVRFLEAGQYNDAAEMYDLDCCIECGLCAYVCVSRMPILHYIKLGKYERSLIQEAEAASE